MKSIIKQYVPIIALAVLPLFAVLVVPDVALASDPASQVDSGYKAAGGGSGDSFNLGKLIQTVVNVLLFIIGAVAVIMIVIGGIRYTISNGDSSQITGAKNTILYAVIGLIVALLAYAIVNFVVTQFI